MSASPKPPSSSLDAARRPSAPRAAPLFEIGVPPRPSGPRPAPPARPSALRAQAPVALPRPAALPAPARPAPPRRRRQSAWPFYTAIGVILLALPAGYL